MSATLDALFDSTRAPITVLHVDDDPSLVELTAEFLQRHRENLTVRMATDPHSALDVDIDEVDCIVSDYDMPGMDGVEFLERVRNEYPSLPFILFTGKGSEAVASEAISAGVTDYLQKGTGTEQYELLCQKIENAVGRQRAQTNYRELFEKVPVGLTIHDPETGLISDTNQAFADFLDISPATFHQHIRAAERKLLNLVCDDQEQRQEREP
jgi:DNA-binding NtrC family response regulator